MAPTGVAKRVSAIAVVLPAGRIVALTHSSFDGGGTENDQLNVKFEPPESFSEMRIRTDWPGSSGSESSDAGAVQATVASSLQAISVSAPHRPE